jgi:hypothetical protein
MALYVYLIFHLCFIQNQLHPTLNNFVGGLTCMSYCSLITDIPIMTA